MKFEKLSSLKFEAFKAHSIENANAIVGGVYETDCGKGKHDTAETFSNGYADGTKVSQDGVNIKNDPGN
jgi:hypothetical protein